MNKLYDIYMEGNFGGGKLSQEDINKEILKNQIVIMKALRYVVPVNTLGEILIKRIEHAQDTLIGIP